MSTIKVAFFAADPESALPYGGKRRLQLAEELRDNQEAVLKSGNPDAVEFVSWPAMRASDLLQALNQTRPQVVHFSGHGGEQGLVLGSSDGRGTQRVNGEKLGRLFGIYQSHVRLVVLNACFSLRQADEVAAVVGCAIGTPREISDPAAILFSSAFYSAIAFGYSVQVAYDQAWMQLSLQDFPEEEYPLLVVRPGVDASQLILVPSRGSITAPPEQAAPTPPSELSSEVPGTSHPVAAPPAPAPDAPNPEIVSRSGEVPSVRPKRSGRRGTRLNVAGIAIASVVAGLIVYPPPWPPNCGSDWSGPIHRPSDALTAPASSSATGGGSSPLASAKALRRSGDHAAAFPLFKRAAVTGNPEAMTFVGIAYRDGQGTAAVRDSALHWLRKAASKQNVPAMIALGLTYQNGQAGNQSRHWAIHWLNKAAYQKQDPEGMRYLANMFWDEAKYDTAFVLYQQAVQAGSLEARVDAGGMFEEGQGTTRDPGQAQCLYRTAAGKGSLRGMVALGRLYQNGIGVSQDYVKARKWYLKAAESGYPEAMNSIGELYSRGLGVEQSNDKAEEWFGRARAVRSKMSAGNTEVARAD